MNLARLPVLQPDGQLLQGLILRVAGSRVGVGSGVAGGEDADQVVVLHLREELLHLDGIEVAHPGGGEALVLDFQHHVGGDDAGVDVGEIPAVVLAHIGLGRVGTDDEEELLGAALSAHPRRIVIKRPLKGPYLAGIKPDYSIKGKTIRYDCLNTGLRAR